MATTSHLPQTLSISRSRSPAAPVHTACSARLQPRRPNSSLGTLHPRPPFTHRLRSQSRSPHPHGAARQYPFTPTASIPASLGLVPSTARVALVNDSSSFFATQSHFPRFSPPPTGQTLALLPAPLPRPVAEHTSPFADLGDCILLAFSTFWHLHSHSRSTCLPPNTVHACLPPPRPMALSVDSPGPRPTNLTARSHATQVP